MKDGQAILVPLLKLTEIKQHWLKLTAKCNFVFSTRKSLIFPKINRQKNTVLKPSVTDRQGRRTKRINETEHENDICKFSCDIRRLYNNSKSILYFKTLITLYDEVRLSLDLIPQNLRPREKCLLDSKNPKSGSDFHVIL